MGLSLSLFSQKREHLLCWIVHNFMIDFLKTRWIVMNVRYQQPMLYLFLVANWRHIVNIAAFLSQDNLTCVCSDWSLRERVCKISLRNPAILPWLLNRIRARSSDGEPVSFFRSSGRTTRFGCPQCIHWNNMLTEQTDPQTRDWWCFIVELQWWMVVTNQVINSGMYSPSFANILLLIKENTRVDY